jgi:hypothetical protein
MLSDNPSDAEIADVLNQLGDPAKLSEQYRQNPRYLISPAVFETYLRTLKIVVPIASGVCFLLGFILGITEHITDAPSAAGVFAQALANGGIQGLSAAFMSLFWTTVAFVIADHATGQSKEKAAAWTVDKLPKELPDDRARIALSDSITDLCVTVVFSAIAVALCIWKAPFGNLLFLYGSPLTSVFSAAFLDACIPVIVISALFGITEAILKIVRRRWSLSVCAATVAGQLVNFAGFMYLITRPNILSDEFISFIADYAKQAGELDIIRFFVQGDANMLLPIFGGFAALGTVLGCVSAIIKTARAATNRSKDNG